MCSIGTGRQHEQLFKAKNINLDFIITILQCYTRTNCIYCDYMVHVHGKIIQNLHNKLLPLTYCISSSLKSNFSLTTFETCSARSWPSPLQCPLFLQQSSILVGHPREQQSFFHPQVEGPKLHSWYPYGVRIYQQLVICVDVGLLIPVAFSGTSFCESMRNDKQLK